MGRAQELFDRACKPYAHAQGLVKDVAEGFRMVEKETKGSTNFNPGITMAEFDQILQGVLLTQALADGDFDRLERQFIDLITEHGDLLRYISFATDGDISLTWDEIAWMDNRTQGELVKLLPSILENRCQDFLSPFLIIEKIAVDVDFMGLLVDDIIEIAACLANVDGKAEEIEKEGLKAMLTVLLLNPWFEMRKQLQ